MPNPTDPTIDPTPAPNGADPAPVDWEAKYNEAQAQLESAIKHSRDWENKSKANYAKAQAYDELKKQNDASVEQVEAANKRIAELEAELGGIKAKQEHAALVASVAAAKGVDATLLSMVKGDTQEELEAAADALSAHMASIPVYPAVNDGGASKAPVSAIETIEEIKNPFERIAQRAQYLSEHKE